MRMFSVLLIVFFTNPCLGPAQESSQTLDSTSKKLALNRLIASLRVAHKESMQSSSELELVDQQRRDLKDLRGEYEIAVKEFYRLESIENDEKAATRFLAERIPEMERKLNKKILLPHQAKILRTKVFDDLLLKHDGNLLQMLAHNYPDEFTLDDSQRAKLKEIEKRVESAIDKLKKQFEKDLQSIRDSACDEAEKTLNNQQVRQLKKYKG